MFLRSDAYVRDMIELDHFTAAEFTDYIPDHPHTLIYYHYEFRFGAYTNRCAHHSQCDYSWFSEQKSLGETHE